MEISDEILNSLKIYNDVGRDHTGILNFYLICRVDVILWLLRLRLERLVTDNKEQMEQISLLLE